MLTRLWNNKKSHWVLVGLQKGAVASLSFYYETKRALTIWPNSCAPWYLPKRTETVRPHKNLHTDVYRSFIHNRQILEAPKMSFNKLMNKWTVVHIDTEILLSTKKKWGIKPRRCGGILGYITNWKKPLWWGCMIPTVRDSGKSKMMEIANGPVGGGRDKSAGHRGL